MGIIIMTHQTINKKSEKTSGGRVQEWSFFSLGFGSQAKTVVNFPAFIDALPRLFPKGPGLPQFPACPGSADAPVH